MKKRVYLIIVTILLLTLTTGCTKATGENTRVIKSPTNNNLKIAGKWEIKSIEVFDEELNVFEDIDSIIGKYIEFTNDKMNLVDSEYIKLNYKLKSVDKNYILSYESNLTIEPFMNGKERIDLISITSNNNMIGEFILTEKNKGYIMYMGTLIEVDKVSNAIVNKDSRITKEIENNYSSYSNHDDEDEIGLMLGLKNPRVKLEDGSFTREIYRTLWISFKDGELMPIVEKENIIFPRMNGIWSLKNKVLETENSYEEYFEVASLDGKSVSNYEKTNKDVYKNITFIGNNYIGGEQYIGEKFENIFTKYGVVPVDNINSNSGLDIEDLYSKDINSKYKMEYEKALDNIYLDYINKVGKTEGYELIMGPKNVIDYSNFTVKRKDGKWVLVGNLGIVNKDRKAIEYPLNIMPNDKLLNYDSLIIPWKQLKGDIPFIRDAYISPNDKIAVILFEDNLAIYEIKDKMLKGAPLANLNIGNEEVIMAEWSTGAYVENWSKVFEDGIDITN